MLPAGPNGYVKQVSSQITAEQSEKGNRCDFDQVSAENRNIRVVEVFSFSEYFEKDLRGKPMERKSRFCLR